MAAKKATKRPRAGEEAEAAERIMAILATHEAAIRQLAEVVVNLHANVRAHRDAIDALIDGSTDSRVAGAKRRLRRVTLKE
jgi:hypothetical protein